MDFIPSGLPSLPQTGLHFAVDGGFAHGFPSEFLKMHWLMFPAAVHWKVHWFLHNVATQKDSKKVVNISERNSAVVISS